MDRCPAKGFWVLCAAAFGGFTSISFANAAPGDSLPWINGEPVPVAGPSAHGPIGGRRDFVPSLTGVANITGEGPHDLIVRGRTVFPWAGMNENGVPFFHAPVSITSPNAIGSIIQGTGDDIVGVFRSGKTVTTLKFSHAAMGFEKVGSQTLDLAEDIGRATGFRGASDQFHLFFSLPDGQEYHPDDFWSHDPRYQPFDAAGIWRGNLTYDHLNYASFYSLNLGAPVTMSRISPTTEEFLFGNNGLTMVNLGPGREHDLIGTNKQGVFRYYRNSSAAGVSLERAVYVRNPRGIVARHPVISPAPVAFPNPETGLSDLIVGDTARVWYYRFTGQFMEDGGPVYEDPVLVTADGAHLVLGALPVISPGDLTGNDLIDLISGNDAGELLFIENVGTPGEPAFAPPVPLIVDGEPLRIQAGYHGSVQGPGEARWGYTCPTLFDWNGDGHLDIVMNSILGEYVVLFQTHGTHPPEFRSPQPLYVDGLDLHLTWRTQPGVTDWGKPGEAWLVTFDEKDLLRLYRRVDEQNLEAGELLRLEDGRPIEANDRGAGQRGRTKIQVVDWTGDGIFDLLLGTRRVHSVPSPEGGLPQSLGAAEREASVLLLRNVGSNEDPVFAFPELMKFQGENIAHGVHSCTPVAVDFGRGNLDLLVGEERGSLFFYEREDLTP